MLQQRLHKTWLNFRWAISNDCNMQIFIKLIHYIILLLAVFIFFFNWLLFICMQNEVNVATTAGHVVILHCRMMLYCQKFTQNLVRKIVIFFSCDLQEINWPTFNAIAIVYVWFMLKNIWLVLFDIFFVNHRAT